ncbi:MAG: XdhC/CoxI family protein [Bacteroidetes bacterium]|nr:XdhC/CoxI family protein [Bacteroidota bacterium]
MENIYETISEVLSAGKPAVLCVVTQTKGSTPRKAGAKMIVMQDGSITGTIGGGAVEKQVAEEALGLITGKTPHVKRYELHDDLDMHCGGHIEVYMEPIVPQQRLFIFGAGHVGKAVTRFARQLGFRITVADDREGIFDSDEFAGCECIRKSYREAVNECEFDDNSYVVIVTPQHKYDEAILAAVARKPHAYLGMIGSRSKVKQARERFLKENILTKEELDAIDMPIGIKFAAETPAEIAVSIVAKMIDVRNTYRK